MSKLITLLLLAISCTFSTAQWSWGNHGKPPVYTGMAIMMSGNNPKLFGVGNGNLQERLWTGSAWTWANHGAPSGLHSGERLASKPCVMTDGKVYIITNRGRLVERYWTGTAWAWAHHNKPSGVRIRSTTCTCTYRGYIARVFVVGNNFKLYERYWSSSSNSWLWRYHGSPPGTSIGPANIDSCNTVSCDTLVYVVGSNGILYRRHITTANPGIPSWQVLGRPSFESVRSVRVGNVGGDVFISTNDNDICQCNSPGIFSCFGKPSGSTNSPSVAISKPVLVNSCSKLPGTARYVFMHGWDPSTNKRARLWGLKVTGTSTSSWQYHGSVGSCCYYIDAPEVFMSWGCPKSISVRSDGYVYERYLS